MKRRWKVEGVFLFALMFLLAFGVRVQAAGADTIKPGIYADDIDLSGKTSTEAKAAIEAYVREVGAVPITLTAAAGNNVTVTAAELGVWWTNPELVEQAQQMGKVGNIIERYKALRDLEHENYVFRIELGFDVTAINDVLLQKCVRYDQKAVNAVLKRVDDEFQIIEGQVGYMLDVELSIDNIYDRLMDGWDRQSCVIPLEVVVEEPRGKAEELKLVTDVLGSFTTSYKTSGTSRRANVENGCRLADGITLYPGEEFSTYELVSPFTEANGYYEAASYLNGKVVDSLGGGICQVSTTLYNAVLKAELKVTERHNHSMVVAYVDPSADAAIAESAGKDFRFVNNTDYPVYIEGYTKDRKITFNIYGRETRDPGRAVRYESEVLEVIAPSADQIYANAGQPLGYIVTDSAHTGYKARLWKIVTENGVEVSREQVNSSSYKMTPRSATVGTATADPNAYNEIMAAIGTGNIDHVKNVIAILTAPAPAQ